MRLLHILFLPLTIFFFQLSTGQANRGFKEITEEKIMPGGGKGQNYAILIANQEYSDKSIPQLEQPIQDARKLKDVLTEHYRFQDENVKIITNSTRADIIYEMEAMGSVITEEDNLIIFYAGHGKYDEQKKQGYWLPSDARKNRSGNWISNSDIRDNLKGIKARHILVISDACFSGGIFRSRSIGDDAEVSIRELNRLPSRRAMTSGAMSEVQDNSVFVEYLVKRLKENKNPYITAQQLFVSFQTAVINNSTNNQAPQYGIINEVGDEGGDFIFTRSSVMTDALLPTSFLLSSSELDAEVSLNGTIIGKANPYLKMDKITSGPKVLEVKKKGFIPVKQNIVVAENRENRYDILLEPMRSGRLTVRSNIPASLIINDKAEGVLDGERVLPELAFGEYSVKLQRPGYKVYATRLTINENREYVIDATLKQYAATLKLNGSVFGKVYLDGEFIGNAPQEKFEIPVGRRTILVAKAGYIDYEREVDFVADKNYTIPYTLTAKTVGSALYRSAMFPGSGQRYQERSVMGVLYSLAFLGAAGATVKTQMDLNDRIDNYNTFADAYINEEDPSVIPLRKQNLLIAESSKNKAEDLRNISLAGLAGIYLINLLDVVIFEPTYVDDISISSRWSPASASPTITATIAF